MTKFKSIAIDGPSGAGKSTVAKILSQKINYIYLDTGALYRAIGLYMINNNIDLNDQSKCEISLKNLDIKLIYQNQKQNVILNGENVTSQLRSPNVSKAASQVSAFKPVRDFLFGLQKNISNKNNVIMDGRDIATVILPQADLKIFLTASAQIRAQRRFKELKQNTQNITFESVYQDLIKRDINDSSREIAPLKKAKDALLIDSSQMKLSETVDYILNIIKERLLI